MRNLKKVLSLVLALAMVLSICMVGAGAVNYDDFTDEENISKKEAVATLVNLDVINGYNDGKEFRPQGNVTRAEMVTMICRVLAGGDNMIPDATKPVPTYTDVRNNPSAAWAETYIEYCTSLGIVSGKGNGIFDPMADVTAAEASKMVMTAVGYNADIEQFKGIGWDINTMAKASTLKLLTNLVGEISANTPVTREQVAQLIYNAMTIPMVQNYNGSTANLWIGSGANAYQETLMEKSFNAKKVTGVVVANEWASLDAPKPIKEGTTKLYILDNEGDIAYDGNWSKFVSTKEFQDETLTVNVSTTLEQVGSSVTVLYKTDTRQSVFGIVMDSGLNHVVEFTKGGKIDTKDMEFGTKKGTTYFVNYEYERFGYDDISADLKFVYTYFVDKDGKQTTTVANIVDTKVETVRVDDRVTEDELELIKAAYNQQYIYKDAQGNKRVGTWGDGNITYTSKPTEDPNYVTGPLTLTYGNNDDPVNNDYTWTKFTETFLDFKGWTSTLYDQIDRIENGNYAKLVDCDNDGVAEFFLETDYIMDELTSVKERDGQYEYGFFSKTDYIDTGRDGNVDKIVTSDELSKNDIVVYTIIDGIAYVDLADMLTATVNTVSYRNESITADGEEYFQSGIVNATDYAQYIVDVDEKVDYEFFFDKYGYIRIYRLVDGQTVYGLLTEAYTTNEFNGKYIKNTIGIVELKPGAEKIAEYKVENYATSNPFFEDVRSGNNLLTYTRDMLDIRSYDDGVDFVWTDTNLNKDKAETNVAKYVLTEDGVKLATASKRATNRAGEYLYYADASRGKKITEDEWKAANPNGNWAASYPAANPVMAVDYVQLDVQSLNAGAWRYDATVDGDNNVYVNAVHDTEYYLVNTDTSKGIKYFTDYTNLPKIDKDKVRAMYAVAENTEYDSDEKDYWVANVIVIELSEWNIDYDSVGLLYNNPSKTIDTVRYLDTLNSATENPSITLVPGSEKSWAGQWDGYGFYELRETKVDGSEMSAESIDRIYKDYASHGIYAGEVKRVEKVDERGGYIVVDEGVSCKWPSTDVQHYLNHKETTTRVSVTDVPVYVISANREGLQQLKVERYDAKSAGLATGDEVIWVTDGRGSVSYIVLVNDVSDSKFKTISWLRDEYVEIVEDRNHAAKGEVLFYGVADTNVAPDQNATAGVIEVTYAQAKANDLAGKRLVVTNGTSVTLDGGNAVNNQPVLSLTRQVYTLAFVDGGNKIVTYQLIQQAAKGVAELKDKAGTTTYVTVQPAGGTAGTLALPANPTRIQAYLDLLTLTDGNSSIEWLIQLHNEPSVKFTGMKVPSDKLVNATTDEVKGITAVVTSEDGTVTAEYKYNTADPVPPTPEEADKAALETYKTGKLTTAHAAPYNIYKNEAGVKAADAALNALLDALTVPAPVVNSDKDKEIDAAVQAVKDAVAAAKEAAEAEAKDEINQSVVGSDRYADEYKEVGFTTNIVKSADGKSGEITVAINELDFVNAYSKALAENNGEIPTAANTAFGAIVGSGFTDVDAKYAWYGPRWLAPEGAATYDLFIKNDEGDTIKRILGRGLTEMDGKNYAVEYFNITGNLLKDTGSEGSPNYAPVNVNELQLKSYTRIIEIQFYDASGDKLGDMQTWTLNIG